uniref:Uncharacterized protein n=1 Tax=viral metagenome TaxID=1070528 RepID=A0A6C0KHV2_9ZZZZ
MFNIALCNMQDYELNSDKSSIPYSKFIYQYKFWKDMKEYVVIKNKYLQTITRLKTVPLHHRVLHKNHLRYVFKQYYLYQSHLEVNDIVNISV